MSPSCAPRQRSSRIRPERCAGGDRPRDEAQAVAAQATPRPPPDARAATRGKAPHLDVVAPAARGSRGSDDSAGAPDPRADPARFPGPSGDGGWNPPDHDRRGGGRCRGPRAEHLHHQWRGDPEPGAIAAPGLRARWSPPSSPPPSRSPSPSGRRCCASVEVAPTRWWHRTGPRFPGIDYNAGRPKRHPRAH